MLTDPRLKGIVRRGQLIGTYGVGAVIAVEDESFMVAGLDRWAATTPNVHEPRLERQLGVFGFVTPPDEASGKQVPIYRFPMMYSCPKCRRLQPHGRFCRQTENQCDACQETLVPSRFVVACSNGHIDDFPYFEWVHSGKTPDRQAKHTLTIETTGVSASLKDISIRCSCAQNMVRTMNGAFGKDGLKGVISGCSGRRPWLGTDDKEDCTQTPRTLQRGASNVYFGLTRSAISIPPWSEGAFKLLNTYWAALKHLPDDTTIKAVVQGMDLSAGTPYTVENLADAVKQRQIAEQGGGPVGTEATLRSQEYEALTRGRPEMSASEDFVCVPADGVDADTRRWFDQVMLVKRLREVRVLEKFTRLLPPTPADPPGRQAPLSKEAMDWLPAIEVVGEGVFLSLEQTRLQAWEKKDKVITRANRIDDNYAAKFRAFGSAPDKKITPRLLLIHTLAHILIDQWSLESGYPTSSLRERLYVSDEMRGFLIYTATSDSAGSLGGVVGQADKGRLRNALREATARASWCSADPLCIEAEATGADALNLAACHSCTLLPETSCETGNILLDRAMIIGTPEDPDIGFFEELLLEI